MWWMQRHLDKTELADWFLSHGGVPHPTFSEIYRHPRNREIRSKLDSAVRKFWDVLTSDAYRKAHLPLSRSYDLRDDLDLRESLTVTELITHLSLRLDVRPSIYRKFHDEDRQGSFLDQFQCVLKISNQHFDYRLQNLINDDVENIFVLAEPLTETVSDGMEWLNNVEKASDNEDGTGYSIPSISCHDQNDHVDQFGQIIFLLRKSFDDLCAKDMQKALRIAQMWHEKKYPIFKRLFLYAASIIGKPLDLITLDLFKTADVLWQRDIQRELKLYLRTRARCWQQEDISALIGLILKGPDNSRFAHLSGEAWEDFRGRAEAALLKKLIQGGVSIPAEVRDNVERLTAKYPGVLPSDHSDEFAIYSSGVRSVGWDDDVVPADYSAFVALSAKTRLQNWVAHRDVAQFRKLAVEYPEGAIATLEEALDTKFEGAEIWREGFYGLATAFKVPRKEVKSGGENDDEKFMADKQEQLARAINVLWRLPAEVVRRTEVAHAISQFWRDAPVGRLSAEQYLPVWDRLWAEFAAAPGHDEDNREPVNHAINDPAANW
jgi:hypothetical protein